MILETAMQDSNWAASLSLLEVILFFRIRILDSHSIASSECVKIFECRLKALQMSFEKSIEVSSWI